MAWVSVETGVASRWFIANNTTHNNDTKRNIFVEHQTKFNITMYINRKLLLDGTRVVIKTNLSPMYVAHGGWMFMSFKIRNEQKGKRWKKTWREVQWILVGSREMNESGSVNPSDDYLYTIAVRGNPKIYGRGFLMYARFHDKSRDSETPAAKTGTLTESWTARGP